MHVRYNDSVAFDGTVSLPEATTTTLDDVNGTAHNLSSDSVLYLLSLAQASSNTFSISDLEYEYGEFYIKCVSINATSTINACAKSQYGWNYVVDGLYSSASVDQYIATTSDNIYLYYGDPYQFSVSATSTDTITPVSVTVQKYDYTNNTWLPLSGEIVGATQPNPDPDSYYPLVIATSTSDDSGTASLLFLLLVLIMSVFLMISIIPLSQWSWRPHLPLQEAQTDQGSSGGNGSGAVTHNTINEANALQFLAAKQEPDGSFGESSMYTDWAAIALSTGPQSQSRSEVSNYERSTPGTSFSSVTDYERHAMALEALGINPYNGTSFNYIQPIVDAFNGTEVGDPNLINDDIFAIFPLMKAGYTSSDTIIQKTIAYIVSQQSVDSSWDESVDLTAAASQALSLNQSLSGVSQAVAHGRSYLAANQQSNGGFGSADSTSWALQAIASLGESPASWSNNNTNPNDYLYADQQSDGGLEPISTDMNTRIWATAYAIPAALGESWSTILSSFPLQTATSSSSGNSSNTSGDGIDSASQTTLQSTSTTAAISQTASTSKSLATSTPINYPPVKPLKLSITPTASVDSRGTKIVASTSSSTGSLSPKNSNPYAAAAAESHSDNKTLFIFGIIVVGLAVIVGGIYVIRAKSNT